MAWQTITRARPGDMASASSLQKLITNILYVRGQDTAISQTEIITESPHLFEEYISSTNTTAMGLRSEWDSSTANLSSVHFNAEVGDGEGLNDGQFVEINGLLGITAGVEEVKGRMLFVRHTDAQDNNAVGSKVFFQTAYTDSGGNPINSDPMIIAANGTIGLNMESAGYNPDIGGGSIDITGDYRIGGSALIDWVLTPGVPDNLSTSGGVKLYAGSLQTTIEDGTAPVVVASTTLCPNIDAWLLDGYTWHNGLTSTPAIENIGSSSTDAYSGNITLDRDGNWLIIADGSVINNTDADIDKVFSIQIKKGATLIGAAASVSTHVDPQYGTNWSSEAKSFRAIGFYAGLTNDVIKLTASLASGSGSSRNSIAAKMTATWIGP